MTAYLITFELVTKVICHAAVLSSTATVALNVDDGSLARFLWHPPLEAGLAAQRQAWVEASQFRVTAGRRLSLRM